MTHHVFLDHFAASQHLAKEGKLAEAIAEMELVLQLRPDHTGALLELGRMHLMHGDAESARRHLTLAVRQSPNHVEALTLLSHACVQFQDWDEAETHLRRAIRLPKGETAEAWALLAWVSLVRQRRNQAYRRSSKALKLDPGCALAHLIRALILMDQEDFDGATAALHEAMTHGPESGFMHVVRAQLAAAIGDIEQARSAYQEALRWPGVQPAIIYRQLLSLADNTADRIECLNKILLHEPFNAAIAQKLIQLYLDTGQLDAAYTELMKVQSFPGADADEQILLLLGDYHVLKGDLNQAVVTYEAAASVAPQWSDPFYRLGEVLSQLGEDEAARVKFRHALQLGRWKDRSSPYKPIIESERVHENRVAVTTKGLGPFQILGVFLYLPLLGIWRMLRQLKSVRRMNLIYPLLALLFAVLFELASTNGRLFERGLSATLFGLLPLTAAGWVVLRGLHLFFKRTLVVHPYVPRWSLLGILASFPFLIPLLITEVTCAAFAVIAYGSTILLVSMMLSRLPLVPDRHTVRRILLFAFPVWLGCFALCVGLSWWVLRGLGVSDPTSVPFEFWLELAAVGYTLAVFIVTAGVAALGLNAKFKREIGSGLLRYAVQVPVERYRCLQYRFVDEWGFSPLYFHCILPLFTSLLLTGLASLSGSNLPVFFSSALNLTVFSILVAVFMDYAFSPLPLKRLRLGAIREAVDIGPFQSFEVPLAIMIMAGLFGAFWVSYSITLANIGIAVPDSFEVPDWFKLNNLWAWGYETFRLMVTGDSDIQATNELSQGVIALISTSEFFFLVLFFSQMAASLQTKGEPKAEQSTGSGSHRLKSAQSPKTYARAGERWTEEERALLVQLIRSGRDIQEITDQLQRSPGAVRSRMEEKGLFASEEPDLQLEAEFHQAMLDTYEVAAKQKYTATRFKQLVRNRGGVEAARLLLAREEITAGLLEFQKLGILEYSAEATVLQERFQPLFTEAEREKARQRLESLGHPRK